MIVWKTWKSHIGHPRKTFKVSQKLYYFHWNFQSFMKISFHKHCFNFIETLKLPRFFSQFYKFYFNFTKTYNLKKNCSIFIETFKSEWLSFQNSMEKKIIFIKLWNRYNSLFTVSQESLQFHWNFRSFTKLFYTFIETLIVTISLLQLHKNNFIFIETFKWSQFVFAVSHKLFYCQWNFQNLTKINEPLFSKFVIFEKTLSV
jgi:hypothetical protein